MKSIPLLLLLISPTIFASPAPPFRPALVEPLSKRIVGTWKMDWGGIKGNATFKANGIMWESTEYSNYCGNYEISGNILTINEHNTAQETYDVITYVFVIETPVAKCKTISGVSSNGTRLVLEKP